MCSPCPESLFLKNHPVTLFDSFDISSLGENFSDTLVAAYGNVLGSAEGGGPGGFGGVDALDLVDVRGVDG